MAYKLFILSKVFRLLVAIYLVYLIVGHTFFPAYPLKFTIKYILSSIIGITAGLAIAVFGVVGFWKGDNGFEDAGMGRGGLGQCCFWLDFRFILSDRISKMKEKSCYQSVTQKVKCPHCLIMI